jgi:predicted nucleic acid-binding protein
LGPKDIVLDYLIACRFARQIDLHPISTLGLLLAARGAGIIQVVFLAIEALYKVGILASDLLVQRILAEAEEQ